MSTFNCPEEVYLAQKLIDLHPWADMVKFARSGGEANSIAIRIARASSGKDKVAFCGYHGWHDWYLAANIESKDNLEGHLLPGLNPLGVPRSLRETSLSFMYNDIDSLNELVAKHDIGTIKMEVSRSDPPKKGFLQQVRKIADEKNIVLIFDECTSGFRETFGGLHKKYDVIPDLAMFGKALGNGYAITACIGKEEIMQSAQETFISSTFWTERIGPTAALKTLEIMEKEKSWNYITDLGKKIGLRWKEIGKKYGLKMNLSGIPALTAFTIDSNDWLKYKTFITQEMLKKSFLATNTVYVCTEHNDELLEEYYYHFEAIIKIISECENGRSIDSLLDGPVCHSGFARLN